MKLGLLVETEEALGWEDWTRTVVTAEGLGFDSVWISDHLQSPWEPRRHGLDPWIALAVAATRTRRVRLGTLVSPVTFRSPALVARMAESVDLLAPGRVVIGLGLGWNAEEHAAAGLDFPGVAERSKRLEKGIGRVRSELGQHRIPIMVGGKGRRSTLPVVARCADWWNTTTSSEAEFVQLAEVLDGLCGEVGRDPSEIRRSIAVGFLVGRDEADLEQRGRRMRNVVPPLAASSDVLTAARDMGWFVGTVEQVAAALADFDRAGVDDVILGHYNLEDVDALELMASLV